MCINKPVFFQNITNFLSLETLDNFFQISKTMKVKNATVFLALILSFLASSNATDVDLVLHEDSIEQIIKDENNYIKFMVGFFFDFSSDCTEM